MRFRDNIKAKNEKFAKWHEYYASLGKSALKSKPKSKRNKSKENKDGSQITKEK